MVARALTVALALMLCCPMVGHAQSVIDQAIAEYDMGAWYGRIHHIAGCESHEDPTAYNRRSGATGTFQFIPSTAANLGIDAWDEWQNVYAAVGLMAAGKWSHWYACDPWQWRR